MEITASLVKELRDKTGLSMMLCKSALVETNGDMEKAIDNLRKQGQQTAQKRAGRSAKQGKVSIVSDATTTIMYEVNSETDFVARNDDFLTYVKDVGALLLANKPADMETAKKLPLGDRTVETKLTDLIGKIGENISFRRFVKVEVNQSAERACTYIHGEGRIGIIVKLAVEGPALNSDAVAALGKDLAMQVAAASPAVAVAVSREEIPADIIAKEKEIYLTQAQNSGKPEKIWDKMVEGKLDKFYKDAVLLEQGYIRDPEKSVGKHIEEVEKTVNAKIKVVSFVRYELGAEE